MRTVKEIEMPTRPGRCKPVADTLHVRTVVVGDGERRERCVLCLNPQEAEPERASPCQAATVHPLDILILITSITLLMLNRSITREDPDVSSRNPRPRCRAL
jgi:hypothetical protein